MRVSRFTVAFVLLGWLAAGCIPPPLTATEEAGRSASVGDRPPQVRVRLADTSAQFLIRGEDRFVVRAYKPGSDPVSYSTRDPVRIVKGRRGWTLYTSDGVTLERRLRGVWIRSLNTLDRIWINGEPYYGSLVIGTGAGGEPLVVNRLNLDVYLIGVLTPELGERSADEFEAVKAQAVASRTYALAHLGQYPGASYDLRADVGDQIYVGASQPRDWVRRAVDRTRGEVLTYGGHMIQAYYHSTCGGHTEDIEDVWQGRAPVPYLVSVDDDTACHWSKYTSWSERFDSTTLLRNLRAYRRKLSRPPVPDFTSIRDIRVNGQTAGGRSRALIVVTSGGQWTIAADRIRWALGRPSRPGSILPSSKFTLKLSRAANGAVNGAVIEGSGYGHGVGMCQCGMIGRARAGEHYREILKRYYTGARIQRVY